ncbi:hypothetical protein FA13DRAFT_321936 [Coprinellus micaceus]|uniref:Uncharacterized protein n=1 Tax=Coprinellus micaceus TaxID=71717 RepID=A0A4Y7TEM0_COPMI|nr:hypothetical protein FA13DRAFT_320078 [Coprinellus micaceus]TEB32027.1 hypothetical protein FA13DRAFT_321936 [Coprinellus micaceus]
MHHDPQGVKESTKHVRSRAYTCKRRLSTPRIPLLPPNANLSTQHRNVEHAMTTPTATATDTATLSLPIPSTLKHPRRTRTFTPLSFALDIADRPPSAFDAQLLASAPPQMRSLPACLRFPPPSTPHHRRLHTLILRVIPTPKTIHVVSRRVVLEIGRPLS